jgi:hypothetical protein
MPSEPDRCEAVLDHVLSGRGRPQHARRQRNQPRDVRFDKRRKRLPAAGHYLRDKCLF